MAHPTKTRRRDGKIWHLEDSGLTRVDANALVRHLKHTEDKLARKNSAPDGYEVWWAKA